MRSLIVFLAAVAAFGQTGLGDASLEQLLNVEVTSVSKKEQKLWRTPAAVTVIGQEDIRRSGATSLPGLLRLVPGVQVVRIDANAWAITIRGFNSRYSDKVLVLIDGRSVYTPSFSGVYWDQIDQPLEDIERIEVIRGPGATVWGSNAVNGVVNIITRKSQATQGGLASAAIAEDSGTHDLLRYGGQLAGASGPTYRVFGKYTRVGSERLGTGASGGDGWSRVQGGFRTDWDTSPHDAFRIEGDLFSNREGQTRHSGFFDTANTPAFKQDIRAAGGSLTAGWSHTSESGAETAVNAWFDTYRRDDLGLPDEQRTFDIETQHHTVLGQRHDVVFGLGYRAILSAVSPGYPVSLAPLQHHASLYSAFLQDEIRLADAWWLTLGAKIEHNAFTGFEFEPTLRIAWTPAPRQTWWAAASRATRLPSRLETGANIDIEDMPVDATTSVAVRLYGNPAFRSEVLEDFEIGYRSQFSKHFSLDLAGFLSFYRRLSTLEPQDPRMQPGAAGIVVEVPWVYANLGRATDYGGEVTLNWEAGSRWRISSGWSNIHVGMVLDPQSRDQTSVPLSNNTPRNSLMLRSLWNLSRTVTWDHTLWWDQRLPNRQAAAHLRLDSTLTWKAGEHVQFSVAGQNLLSPGYCEFGDSDWIEGTRISRTVYGKVTWAF